MKLTLQLEELAMTIIFCYFLCSYNMGVSIWVWLILFFSPDIGMVGYLINTKVGALTYNLFHHKGIAICVIAAGHYLHSDNMISIGILLFAHSSFDRIMGYGLKYSDSFKNTHLGTL